MSEPHAPPDLLREALGAASWGTRLPPAASAFVGQWRVEDIALDALPAALARAEVDARAACRELTPGDHDRWAAVCLSLHARHAIERTRAHAATREALAEAFAAAAEAQLRALPTTRKQAVGGQSLRVAREAVLHAHRAEPMLRAGFERALEETLAEALAPLALDLPDAPERVREALTRADVTARGKHDREQAFLPVVARRGKAERALAHLAGRLAEATLAATSPDAVRWLSTMTLQLVRALREPRAAFPDLVATVATNPMTPAHEAPRATLTETPMTTQKTPSPLLETLKVDATDAAWRTAGSQFVKLARDPLVGVLCRHLGPDDPALRARVAAFLQTELGGAMLSAVLSAGLTALPPTVGPVPERLARELRVRAMSGVGDTLADVLMGPLREVAALYLRDAPAPLDAAPRAVLDARTPALGIVTDDAAVAARRA
jgi:hypothetical protein